MYTLTSEPFAHDVHALGELVPPATLVEARAHRDDLARLLRREREAAADFLVDLADLVEAALRQGRLCLDLIKLAGVDLGKFKVHLATGLTNPPLEAYFAGRFQAWQEYQHQRNFQCDAVLSLIHLRGSRWLFAGAWRVHGVTPRQDGERPWFEYATTEVPGLEHLAGRVVVDFERTERNAYRWGESIANRLVVAQIQEERMRMADFAGYASVLLTFEQLCHVVEQDLPTWRAALKSVAGIYLITDASCGKLYVGSAYGAEGIWSRWATYVTSRHGHNVELAGVISTNGHDHARHFQFSILEVCDLKDSPDDVIARENHWKTVLRSREFGYNAN